MGLSEVRGPEGRPGRGVDRNLRGLATGCCRQGLKETRGSHPRRKPAFTYENREPSPLGARLCRPGGNPGKPKRRYFLAC